MTPTKGIRRTPETCIFCVCGLTSKPTIKKKKKGNSAKGQFTFCTLDYLDCQGV